MATKRQFEDLKTHPAWMEMVQLLSDRLMIVRNELEDEQYGEIDVAIRRGECKNIRFVLTLPDQFIKDKENPEESGLIKEEEDEL